METLKKAIQTMKNEMVPSMGCTEPVALGLAVSRTAENLKNEATVVEMIISSNIFKNAYSVQIPNADSHGIELACALGYVLSKPFNTMEIFAEISKEQVKKAKELVEDGFVQVKVIQSSQFYIECVVKNETENIKTITADAHDKLVYLEINGQVLANDYHINQHFEEDDDIGFNVKDYKFKDFYKWANEVDVKELEFIKDGIEMNMKISELGLEKRYALGVGHGLKELIESGQLTDNLITNIRSRVSAASDFRMSGGNGSVMTYLGSGNQGIESMLPMAIFAEHMKYDEETTLRGLFMGMMCILYMKKHIGRLSPICGAMLAGAGGSAGMVYMMGGSLKQVSGAVQNMMGGIAGMFCDGAKGGCALKLSACAGEAVYNALYAMNGNIITETDGFICESVEDTVRKLTKLSYEAMDSIDMKVIEIMQSK